MDSIRDEEMEMLVVFDARPLRAYVLEVTFGRYDEEAGTIVWPSGADFSPEFLAEAALAVRE